MTLEEMLRQVAAAQFSAPPQVGPERFALPTSPSYTLPHANLAVESSQYDPELRMPQARGSVDLGGGFGLSGAYQQIPGLKLPDASMMLRYRREF